MPTYGPSLGTAAVSSGSPPSLGQDTLGWSPASAILSESALQADWNGDETDDISQYLRATGFNFAVPAGETIVGVEVTIRRERDGGSVGEGRDYEFKLIVNNAVQGNNLNTLVNWSSEANFTYGGPTEIWGLALTPAVVNASDFGVAVAVKQVSGANLQLGVDWIKIKIYTATITTVQSDVSLTTSISTGTTQTDVSLATAVSREPVGDVVLVTSIAPFLIVTEPDPADVITSAEFNITWEFGPTAQSDYRIKIYSDVNETTLVYDSGIVGSSIFLHSVPSGALPAGTLYLRVIAHDTAQTEARSVQVQFSTSYPTSVNVTGVTARVDGGVCDPDALPKIDVRWTQIVPGAGETFVQYDVLRREVGVTAWTRIAIIEAIATVRYRDANTEPNTNYEYSVLWQAASGASILISAVQTSLPRAMIVFDWSFLHVANDFSRWVRLEVFNANQEQEQDIAYFQPWGRRSPTAHVGEALHARFSLPALPQQLQKTAQWDKLLDLLDAQREGHVLCLRIGRARTRHFVTINMSRRQLQERSYNSSLELIETFYDEAVTE